MWLYWNINWMQKAGISKIISSLPIPKNVKDKTWFILGTGSSINNYNSNHWKRVEENFSVGINNWVLHEFIPDYFMIELIGNIDLALKVMGIKSQEICKRSIIIKGNYLNSHHYQGFESRVAALPEQIKERLFLAKDFPIPGDNQSDFRRSLRWLNRLGFFRTKNRLAYLAQSRASITTAIFMGIKLGFKKIVLCGVDLNNCENFFTGDQEKYLQKGYPLPVPINVDKKGQNEPRHWTDRMSDNSLRVSEIIKIIQEELGKKRGIQIYVGSKSSSLYPHIPLYEW